MTFVMFKRGFSNLVCIRYVEISSVPTNTALGHVTCSQGVVVQPDIKKCQIKENLSKDQQNMKITFNFLSSVCCQSIIRYDGDGNDDDDSNNNAESYLTS